MDSGCICFFMKKFLENLLFSRKVTLEKRKLLWFFAGGKQTEGGKMVCFLVGKAKICGKIKFSRPNPFIFIDESRFFVYNS